MIPLHDNDGPCALPRRGGLKVVVRKFKGKPTGLIYEGKPVVGRALRAMDGSWSLDAEPVMTPADATPESWDTNRETPSVRWNAEENAWDMWYLGYNVSYHQDPAIGQRVHRGGVVGARLREAGVPRLPGVPTVRAAVEGRRTGQAGDQHQHPPRLMLLFLWHREY